MFRGGVLFLLHHRSGCRISRIEATIDRDLSLSATTHFHAQFEAGSQRALMLDISSRMKVTVARVDGQPAEVYQGIHPGFRRIGSEPISWWSCRSRLRRSRAVEVEIEHQGSVIADDGEGVYS